MNKKQMNKLTYWLLCMIFLLAGLGLNLPISSISTKAAITRLPEYHSQPYKTIRSNLPEFSKKEKKSKEAFETYSELDELGRCKVAYANICQELMPTQKRESISDIHPSGWKSKMNWERCHLIGFQLAGENANEKNLITGTHYFNYTGMRPFENQIHDYVVKTGNHVLYRVTPYYEGENLIASGVQMEAWSVEDKGEGICFNLYVFNVQPGKTIDYKTGVVVDSGKKVSQYIKDGTYKKTYLVSSLNKKNRTFKIGCTALGRVTYSKQNGSTYLSVNRNGSVTVKKETPVGTYTMRVKVKAAATAVYKSKTLYRTVMVIVKGKTALQVKDLPQNEESESFMLNTNTKVFHKMTCGSVSQMSDRNKQKFTGSREEAIAKGYRPCGNCKP